MNRRRVVIAMANFDPLSLSLGNRALRCSTSRIHALVSRGERGRFVSAAWLFEQAA
ncbi:MAG: hypothetical protein M0R77_18235 [Gammaproteobacteria bacterium]|nr:hypothetical protein [Gammaproteobacteria bacterium]